MIAPITEVPPSHLPVRGRWAAGFAAFCAAAMIGVYWFFVRTAGGQRLDETAFDGSKLGRTRLWRLADPVLDVVSVSFVAAVLVLTIVIAILRRRWVLILQVAVILGAGNLITQVLKRALERAEFGVIGSSGGSHLSNTLPSGHTTVAATVSVAVLLVLPRYLRPYLAIIGAMYVAATGISTLVGGWHRMSDVFAAIFVTGAVAAFVLIWGDSGAIDARTANAAPYNDPSPAPSQRKRPQRGGAIQPAATALLLLVSLVTAIASAVAMRSTWLIVGGDEAFNSVAARADLGRRVLAVAYGGGALAVVALSAALFAMVLLLAPSEPRRSRATIDSQ